MKSTTMAPTSWALVVTRSHGSIPSGHSGLHQPCSSALSESTLSLQSQWLRPGPCPLAYTQPSSNTACQKMRMQNYGRLVQCRFQSSRDVIPTSLQEKDFERKEQERKEVGGQTSSSTSLSNKSVIQLTTGIYDYILRHTREPLILKQLREETSTMRGSQMQVSPDQAQLLAMLIQLTGAKRCIEVGVYTGYSALAVALALPPDGQLVACDRSDEALEVARKYFRLGGVENKVEVRCALATETLKDLLARGDANSYDFAFLDADKRSYVDYYEMLLQLVRTGGVIAVDNVLWHGKVADPGVSDVKTEYLRQFNKMLFTDKRVSTSMIPIGDGMVLCRKL